MKTAANIILSLLLFASCSHEKTKPEQPAPKAANSQVENFDAFLERFSSDSVFQKSRIKFPLSNEVYDIDTDKSIPSTIKANEWNFFNIKKAENRFIFNTKKEKDRYILNIRIEDTGVYVDYIFEQQDGKWTLVKIDDQST